MCRDEEKINFPNCLLENTITTVSHYGTRPTSIKTANQSSNLLHLFSEKHHIIIWYHYQRLRSRLRSGFVSRPNFPQRVSLSTHKIIQSHRCRMRLRLVHHSVSIFPFIHCFFRSIVLILTSKHFPVGLHRRGHGNADHEERQDLGPWLHVDQKAVCMLTMNDQSYIKSLEIGLHSGLAIATEKRLVKLIKFEPTCNDFAMTCRLGIERIDWTT